MKLNYKSAFLAFAAVPLLLASCSVKEDRSECPVYLTVRSDGHVGEPGFAGTLTYNIHSSSQPDYMRATGDMDEFVAGRIFKVPRAETVGVAVLGGLHVMTFTPEALLIPHGMQCDSLVGGSGVGFWDGDLGEVQVPLNREYATVTIGLTGDVTHPYPFYYQLEGNVDGYWFPGMEPHPGEFTYRMDHLSGDIFRGRVPRQRDDTLTIGIYSIETGERVSSIDLGQTIAGMGYDWKARDLEDINLNVDFARLTVSIFVRDWVQEVIIQLVI